MNTEKDQEKFFLQMYTDLAEPVFRHCYIRVSNRDKAKDITQDTFIKAWKFLQKGGRIDNAKAFIYKIANNLIIDEYRKRKNESLDELEEKGFEIADPETNQQERSAEARSAMEAINKIDEKYRNILIMRFADDLTISEIAEITGETENLVSVKIHRGIIKLREILKVKNES